MKKEKKYFNLLIGFIIVAIFVFATFCHKIYQNNQDQARTEETKTEGTDVNTLTEKTLQQRYDNLDSIIKDINKELPRDDGGIIVRNFTRVSDNVIMNIQLRKLDISEESIAEERDSLVVFCSIKLFREILDDGFTLKLIFHNNEEKEIETMSLMAEECSANEVTGEKSQT